MLIELDPTRRMDRIFRILKTRYGLSRHGNLRNIRWELIFIIVSLRTSEQVYVPVFRAIRRRYDSLESLGRARISTLRAILKPAGLSGIRAIQIKQASKRLASEWTDYGLKNAARKDPEFVERYLCTFRGVGLKVAKCVLMYAADLPVLPVDTHVWRVMTRLGFAAGGRLNDHKASYLEAMVPPRLRYAVHVICLSHGRLICKPRPLCAICPVSHLCPSAMIGEA